MALYKWPTDPPGKPASHTITYQQHQQNVIREQRASAPPSYTPAPVLTPPPAPPSSGPPKGLTANDIWQNALNNASNFPMAGQPPNAAQGGGPPAPPEAPPPPKVWAPDSGYNDAVAFNKKTHDDIVNNANADERKVKYEFGFDDPTNPFSRASEQKRQYLIRGQATSNQLGARGQLFSGANQKTQNDLARNQEKSTAELRAAYDAALEELRRRRTGADTNLEGANLQALKESKQRQGLD